MDRNVLVVASSLRGSDASGECLLIDSAPRRRVTRQKDANYQLLLLLRSLTDQQFEMRFSTLYLAKTHSY